MPNKLSNIAIITARVGSKRIPRKNIKDFLGKPIIAYSIEASLQSGIFQEVIVSTDDAEIAEVAQKYGAKVPFLRSAKNSDDFAGTGRAIHKHKSFASKHANIGYLIENQCFFCKKIKTIPLARK